TEALADDVGHAHHLEDGPHRAAGNDAVALLGRRHQHARGTVLADHLVVDRAVLQLHLDHVATRRFHGLRHRNRHFLGLALAHADAAIAVADDGERREAERAAALDDLGDAVDRDHLFLQAVVAAFALGTRLKLCHLRIPVLVSRSELEAGFARRFGQRLDAAVVREPGAIERDPLDAGCFRLLGDALADDRRRGDVAAFARDLALARQILAYVGFRRRGARENARAVVGNHVGVDVQVRPVHREPRGALHGNAHASLPGAANA